MYFAGKDLGLKEASRLDQTDDIEQALAWVFPSLEEIWKITLWKNKDDDDFWILEGDEMFIRLVFDHCPIRDSSLAAGVSMGGVTCQTVHGYAAGMLEKVFGRKVDLHTEHMGPDACLVALRTVME
jgi:predicted hydrocarbon binding protein